MTTDALPPWPPIDAHHSSGLWLSPSPAQVVEHARAGEPAVDASRCTTLDHWRLVHALTLALSAVERVFPGARVIDGAEDRRMAEIERDAAEEREHKWRRS